MQPSLVELRNVSKYFGTVIALNGVSARPGRPSTAVLRRSTRTSPWCR